MYICIYIYITYLTGYSFSIKLCLDEGIMLWDLKHGFPRQKLRIYSNSHVYRYKSRKKQLNITQQNQNI